MAKIPLRVYLKEIENYIERGEIDQAVTHAKNILKSYPKHIDTYRLLGKAFLESQRYSEAADILQRVLSVLPDDFISQVGMSIIREDEGNLDAAIWHMERAYEVQPFNPAVQDELRRLYGRRDGVEPPKIRLTRGALVRMYARGELYPQAIAETRAALAEDPQRQDLLVLLARLYYLSDRKNDAAEICSELLRKLPYCYEANRLLAEFLPTTNRAEEAQKFLQRIYALDPYAAFVSPNAPSSDQVPDQVVMVEQFTWEGAMEEVQAPDWTRNAGVEWQESEEEEVLPDWLNTLKPDSSSITQAAAESTVPETTKEEEAPAAENIPAEEPGGTERTSDDFIPDWMKDQGWKASERPADEIMASEEETPPGDIAPADLPDWVQSIAPQEELNQPADETERTEWLDQLLAQPGGTNGKENTLPDRGANPEPSAEVPPAAETSGDELPDWLSQLAVEQPSESAAEETPKPAELEGLPDWSQLGEPSQTEPAPEAGETPDWLRALEPKTHEDSTPVEQAPAWSNSGEAETAEPAVEAGIPDWLQSMAKEETTAGEPAAATPEAGENVPPAMLPDWLMPDTQAAEEPAPQKMAESDLETASEAPGEPTAQVEAPAVIDTSAVTEQPVSETTVPDFSDMDAAMAWLESLAAKQGADEATLVTPPEQRTEEPPEWIMKELAQQEVVAKQEVAAQQEAEVPSPIEPPQEMAETELAGEPESSTVPAEAVPTEAVSTEAGTVETEAAAPEAAEEETAGETPWAATGLEAESALPEVAVELPAGPKVTEESQVPQVEAPVPDLSDMDAAMAWLESLAAKQGADEATLVTPPGQRVETPPEWVRKEMESALPNQQPAEEEPPAVEELPPAAEATVTEQLAAPEPAAALPEAEQRFEEPMAEEQPAAEETPVPDWMKEIQPSEAEAKTGEKIPEWLETIGQEEAVEGPSTEGEAPWAVEEETISATPPAAESLPDWLKETAIEEPAEPAPAEAEAIPDWLKNLGEEGEPEAIARETETRPAPEAFRSAWEPEVELEPSPAVPEALPEAMPEALPQAVTGSLSDIQAALNRGDLDTAIEGYNTFIQHGEYLSETIHDLRDALYRYPVDINILQTLGDAYARNNQLQDALDAYTKAEELLR